MHIYTISDIRLNQVNETFLADLTLALDQLSRLKQVKKCFKLLNKIEWFFLLGHQGAGKTTLIREAEQNIIYEWYDDKERFAFYFCENNVFIEVAEKYLTGNQTELLWYRMFKLLKRYRARLSGMLICLSLNQLLSLAKTQRQAVLNDIKRMMHSAQKTKALSIWLILTHLDVVNGFKEFFDDLLDIERQQSFGLEIAGVQKGSELIELFNHEFQFLSDQINQRLIRCLHQIRDQDARILANDFPMQFEQMASLIRNILRHLFKQEEYIKQMKGIYFVSSKQMSHSIDRIIKPISKKMILSTPLLSSKGRFSRGYFSHEIFSARLNDTSVAVDRSIQELWKLIQLFIGGLALVTTLLLAYSFKKQVDQLSHIEHAIQGYKHQIQLMNAHNDNELIELLGAIESMNHIKKSMQSFNDAWMLLPFMENLKQLRQRIAYVYREVLTRQFIPRISFEFETILNNASHYSDEEVYSALKGYIMLMDAKRFDPVYIALWFRSHWELYQNKILTKRKIYRYSEQLYELLKQNFQPAQMNHQLVFKVRQRLKKLSLPRVVFLKVKNLSDHSGYHLTRLYDSPIPALFTKKGYEAIYLPQVESVLSAFDRGDWVLGHLPDIQPGQSHLMREQIDALYFLEYKRWWQKELSKLHISPVKTMQDAEKIALSHAKVDNQLFNVINALIINTKPFTEFTPVHENFNDYIASQFKPYHHIKTDLLAKLVQNFYDLGHDIQLINAAADPDHQAFLMTKARFMSKQALDPLSQLFNLIQKLPPEIARTLIAYPKEVWAILIQHSESYINTAWQKKIIPFYKNNINLRYPIDPKGSEDISLDHFSSFFGYGGMLDMFFEKHVMPFIETDLTRWRHVVKNNESLSFSESIINQFERAYIIRKMFFYHSSQKPYFEFSLQPLKFTSNISSIVIDFSGQQVYDYQGSHKKTTFHWPANNGSNYMTILLENYKGDIDTIKFVGPWAIFKMMQAYHLKANYAIDQFKIHFSAKHGSGDYLLLMHSKINPFISNVIDKFALKESLFDTKSLLGSKVKQSI